MTNNPQWMLVVDHGGNRWQAGGVNFSNRPAPPIPRPGHPIRINGAFFFVSEITFLTADYQRIEVVVRKTNQEYFAELAGLKSKPKPPRRKRFRG
jgi:hypothetical protein